MPMMNSEARKRAVEAAERVAHQAEARRLAESWEREALREEAAGNDFAAVILHAHARELRAVLERPLSA